MNKSPFLGNNNINQSRKEMIKLEIRHLNESSIKNALETTKPVLIDFYASWCEGCNSVDGIMTEFADENPDVEVYKINVDESADIANKYGVMSVPTVLSLSVGEVKNRAVGSITKDEIKDLLN